jgi:hypothetical protein
LAESTASMTPLFVATEEAKSKEAAILLIKANAEINREIDGISLRNSLIKTFGSEILQYQPNDLDEAMNGLETGNRTKLLQLLHESVIRDTFDDFEAELKSLTASEDINRSAPGAYNLVQVASDEGLHMHLKAMLQVSF